MLCSTGVLSVWRTDLVHQHLEQPDVSPAQDAGPARVALAGGPADGADSVREDHEACVMSEAATPEAVDQPVLVGARPAESPLWEPALGRACADGLPRKRR